MDHGRRLARLIATVILAVGVTSAGGAAVAQEYSGDTGGLVVTPVNPAPGSSIDVSGGGFAPDSTVTITVGGVTVGTVVTDGEGRFSASVKLPSGLLGAVTVAADGVTTDGATRRLTATIRIGLAFTGSSSSIPLAWIGIALTVLGVLLIAAVRMWSKRSPRGASHQAGV